MNPSAEIPFAESKFVYNCSGLGAAELAKDHSLVPVQGHLVMLKNQVPKQMNYMILTYFGEGKTISNQPVQRTFYLFPKHLPDSAPHDIGVIGGTFVEGGNPNTPNLTEYDSMIDEAHLFFGIK